MGIALSGGCGFFNPNNPPNPIWGIWMGPFPTTISHDADSSRWVFTSNGLYLFYALRADGTLLARETGYYSVSGILLVVSADRAGQVEREELMYEVRGDRLFLTIFGGTFVYRRVGSAAEADDLRNALRKPARGDP